jgi:hypothetical protein
VPHSVIPVAFVSFRHLSWKQHEYQINLKMLISGHLSAGKGPFIHTIEPV